MPLQNMKLNLTLCLSALLGVICVQPAAVAQENLQTIYPSIDKTLILEQMEDAGLPIRKTTDSERTFEIATNMNGVNALVVAENCRQPQADCETLSYIAYFVGLPPEAAQVFATLYDRTFLYGRAYTQSDGSVAIGMVSDVSGGITRAHLDELLRLYSQEVLRDFLSLMSLRGEEPGGSRAPGVAAFAPGSIEGVAASGKNTETVILASEAVNRFPGTEQ